MKKIGDFEYKYLFDIDSPYDLRKLPESALQDVNNEVREYMVDVITKVGGHFGAGLGVVELTVALHYVFNTPQDKIVFDTGHQGYPHKILTGRRDRLHTIRKKDGLSGFLKRTESEYDTFGAGHASTSISAALGMAVARDFQNQNHKVISVIGDGAMTGGLAFEAMNNIGFQKRDMIVILNDNNISIEPNVSAFSNYFNDLYATNTVQNLRNTVKQFANRMDTLGDRLRKFAAKLESGAKAIITPGVLFEALGFNYFGPINGNNLQKVLKLLQVVKDLKGPIFLHLMTQKGSGYKPAESDKQNLHAIGTVDKLTGKSVAKKSTPKPPKYSNVFGEAVVDLCKMNPKIVGITAAMGEGTGLVKMEKEFKDRLFDVGIAEGHAVTFAAGMAAEGMIPIVAIYSSFLQRAYDHLVHDCAIQNLHVVFGIDRAGLVGADGPTHHGVLDISYLRPVQNIVIMAPSNEQELRDMLYSAVFHFTNGPVAIRYPRGEGVGVPLKPMKKIELGKSEVAKRGRDVAILGIGLTVNYALGAAQLLEDDDINAEVINTRFVKPLDTDMLDDVFERFDTIITVEDGQLIGGFGSAVAEYANQVGYHNKIEILGIPDKFIDHATQAELHKELGYDAEGIAKRVRELLGRTINSENFAYAK